MFLMPSLKLNRKYYLYLASCYRKCEYKGVFIMQYLQRKNGQSLKENKTGKSAYRNALHAYFYYS